MVLSFIGVLGFCFVPVREGEQGENSGDFRFLFFFFLGHLGFWGGVGWFRSGNECSRGRSEGILGSGLGFFLGYGLCFFRSGKESSRGIGGFFLVREGEQQRVFVG
ncbi:hypothetical protein COCNU_scaffold033108G000010 [Cocos nucifera]|nr:hypothetical protein [Cocos nucifera]